MTVLRVVVYKYVKVVVQRGDVHKFELVQFCGFYNSVNSTLVFLCERQLLGTIVWSDCHVAYVQTLKGLPKYPKKSVPVPLCPLSVPYTLP
jgi:hypothetical protein